MEKLLELLKEYWIAILLGIFGLFALFKKCVEGAEWVIKKFGLETESMRKKREFDNRLKAVETAIQEIKSTSQRNVDMFIEHENAVVGKFTDIKNDIISEIGKLHTKVDQQKRDMNSINEANIETDRAVLRDRIMSGMRYFSQNKGTDGKVHISFSDHENMEALYQRYFARGGNGTIKTMYETEFKHFIIDQ